MSKISISVFLCLSFLLFSVPPVMAESEADELNERIDRLEKELKVGK